LQPPQLGSLVIICFPPFMSSKGRAYGVVGHYFVNCSLAHIFFITAFAPASKVM